MGAVSYTHLDVYKRQVQHDALHLAFGNIVVYRYRAVATKDVQLSPLIQGVVDGFRPVSYTHLDVYKRQKS